MNGNKITILRDPTSDEDAATKRYVDAVDGKLSTLKSEHNTVDGKLSTLRTEYDVHVNMFSNPRRNVRKIDEVADNFFGNPFTADMKFSDIKTSIDTVKKTVDDIVAGISSIVEKLNLLEKNKVPQINNVVYTVASGLLTWSQQNRTIKHTADITGVYRLFIFSSAKFEIFTTYLWRDSTARFCGIVSIVLNIGDEGIFFP